MTKDEYGLLPCPFCGRPAVRFESYPGGGRVLYGVECEPCHLKLDAMADTESDADTAWNMRAKNSDVADFVSWVQENWFIQPRQDIAEGPLDYIRVFYDALKTLELAREVWEQEKK